MNSEWFELAYRFTVKIKHPCAKTKSLKFHRKKKKNKKALLLKLKRKKKGGGERFGVFVLLVLFTTSWQANPPQFCLDTVVFSTACMTDKSKRNLQIQQTQNRILEKIIFIWKSSNQRRFFSPCCPPGLVLWACFPRATLVLFAIRLSSEHF